MVTSIAQQSSPALEQVLSQLKGVRTSMRGWRACCPAHADRKPSLSIGLGEHEQVLLKCFAGCSLERILEAMGLTMTVDGLSAAVGLLELMGNNKSRALKMLGLGAALFESWEGWRIESQLQSALDPLKYGLSGSLTRAGGLLSGPLPALLRIASVFTQSKGIGRAASISAVAGSLMTRIAWVYAGHVSARDWKLPLGIPK